MHPSLTIKYRLSLEVCCSSQDALYFEKLLQFLTGVSWCCCSLFVELLETCFREQNWEKASGCSAISISWSLVKPLKEAGLVKGSFLGSKPSAILKRKLWQLENWARWRGMAAAVWGRRGAELWPGCWPARARCTQLAGSRQRTPHYQLPGGINYLGNFSFPYFFMIQSSNMSNISEKVVLLGKTS